MIKRRVKRIMNTYPSINYQKLDNKLINSEVVSFDVFDTLLKRDIAEVTDIFDIVASQWNKMRPEEKLMGFKEKRLLAEVTAYEKYGSGTMLSDIYEFLDVPDGVMSLEIETEIAFNVANQPLLAIFNHLKSLKKPIYIISDMYLPAHVINKMLHQAGYNGYSKLYVSCEYGKDKISGELFKVVAEENHISTYKLTHVGDSWRADWLGAKKSGMKAHHIARYDNRLSKTQRVNSNSSVTSMMNNRLIDHQYDDYQTFGYTTFGPVLLSFTQWLNKNTIDGTTKFFLARDGHILKRAYELLYPGSSSSEYIYISRKSLKQTLLQYTNNLTEMANLVNMPSTYTSRELAVALNLNLDSVMLPDITKVYTNPYFGQEAELSDFVMDYFTEIQENSKQSGKYFARYLEQFHLDTNLQIIDIGWRGSMQMHLLDFMSKQGRDLDVNGWYLGLTSQKKEQDIKAQAFWFDMKNRSDSVDLASPFQGVLELFFSASHGTTIDYQEENGIIVPVLASYEFQGRDELVQEDLILRKMRESALDFLRDFKNSGLNGVIEMSSEEAFTNLERFGLRPTLQETNKFGNLTFVDHKSNALAKPKSMYWYLKHPSELKYDLFESRWKIGFMKRLLKVPINYHWLYKKIK